MFTRILIPTAAIALLASACASSGGNGNGKSSQPAGGSNSVTISVKHDRLTGPGGKTLYYNTVDTAKSIKCVGECANEWPPVTGTPDAGSGLDDEDFATTSRPDGTTQVTFYGHPLYEFKDDQAGTANGNGMSDEGGHWVVATPEQAAGGNDSGASSDDGSGGYSGGY